MRVKLPDTPSDPNLKAAMAEISEILRRYDIAGICLLKSKHPYGEWLNHITPSWSCAFFEDEEHLRVRAKLADYGSKEARDEALRLTIGMLFGFRDGALRLVSNMDAVLKQISDVVKEIEHVTKFDR